MLIASPVLATAAHARVPTAAFLFTYEPSDKARFEAGYAEHLKWHAARRDRLPWYGWTVASGPRTGLFVDGTFGIPFAAFDARPDPAGDAADSARTFLPHGRARGQIAYALWPQVSTGFTLEDRQPTPLLDAYHVAVEVADQVSFERAMTDASAMRRVPMTWYRGINGTAAGHYLLLVPRADNAGLADRADTFAALIGSHAAAARVKAVDVETWRYRPELSLLPKP